MQSDASESYLPMRVPTRSTISSVLRRIQDGSCDPSVALVYTSHANWPLPRRNRSASQSGSQPRGNPLRISVLDSSFNPPTLAHLALANHPRPQYSKSGNAATLPGGEEAHVDYDAKLLLLSVRNADKTLKPTDASLIQRIEMMMILAQYIKTSSFSINSTHIQSTSQRTFDESSAKHAPTADVIEANIAVAIIDEPTFVGKSTSLLAFLRGHLARLESSVSDNTLAVSSAYPPDHDFNATYNPELSFLVGYDTLERIFSPKYYASLDVSRSPEANMLTALRKFMSSEQGGDNARVVCARRVSVPIPLLPLSTAKQSALLEPGAPALGTLAAGDSRSSQNCDEPHASAAVGSNLPVEPLHVASMRQGPLPGFAQEFITSERLALIDIGEHEQTFSSSAVREMISRGSRGSQPGEFHWRDAHATWRQLVPDKIAQYVIAQGLYATTTS